MPVSGTELLKPLEFLAVESYKGIFCHVNELTSWTAGKDRGKENQSCD